MQRSGPRRPWGWLAGICGLLAACMAGATGSASGDLPARDRLAWELEPADLGGRLAFIVAPDGNFATAAVRPDLEFLGWDRRIWRAEYLGGGQFGLIEPEAEVPIRVTELRYLDWDEQQCTAKLEYGRFTLIKPPRPAPAPPSSASASTGGGPLQVVPIQNPPIVYRSLRLDLRTGTGNWSAALANPNGRLAASPADSARLPGAPTQVLSESGALAMASAQMTNEQLLQRIQKQIDTEQPLGPTPPVGAPLRACFYAKPRYEGESSCVEAGQTQPSLTLRIASLRIDGGPALVSLFPEPNEAGEPLKLSSSSADLGLDWSGRARSLRVESLEAQRGDSDPGAAYFFGEEGYHDYLFQVRAGDPAISDLRPSGRDDAISSVRIEGDAKVALYGDLNYAGREWWSQTGSTSLAITDSFDDRTSSLQVVRTSQPMGAPTAEVAWTLLQAPHGDWTRAHGDTAINYITWGGGEWTASYLGGGRFRHTQRGATQSRESIGMNYVDWKGVEWTATVEGEKFRHTRRDGVRDEVDRAVNYRSWDGSAWSAKLVPPAVPTPH